MAVPPDVIGGETITSEWGNEIRDWATASVELGGADDPSTVLTSSFASGATVVFTKPADWVTYKLQAWGTFDVATTNPAPSNIEVKLVIGGNSGTTQLGGAASVMVRSISVRHLQTGLSGNVTVEIQARLVSGAGSGSYSNVNYIAVRTT